MIIKIITNIWLYVRNVMKENNSKKELVKKWKNLEQGEMNEETHQLDLMEGYVQDESYEESKD